MLKNYDVSTGHSLYSKHRFRNDVHHMVIFDDLLDSPCVRVRLYLTDDAYAVVKKEAANGHIRILQDAEVIEGTIVNKRKKKNSTR